jgi:spoIIIJ-associated protein
MREKRATLEVIAPTVDEAVEKGLADLGLPAEAVEVEVLDQGSRGLFHLGSRQARIRLTVKASSVEATATVQAEPVIKPDVKLPVAAKKPPVEPSINQPAEQVTSFQPTPPSTAPGLAPNAKGEEEEETYELRVARETVSELLGKMKVTAQVTAHYGEPDDKNNRVPLHVDVNGDDLSILIGRRAETLNALQYIAGLIVSKELGHSVPLIVDVEGYRLRRENQLRQLARRMAEQVVKTNRRQVLEPMPAGERRIVHIELRNHPDVTTESIGDEPRRKVTIIPKE